jgi:dihydrofolate synthase / folylpolyglutamate synthase
MNKTEILKKYQTMTTDLANLIGPVRFSSEINLKLERIEHLLEILGNPHHDFPTIHVGGTSGKGSTVTMITSILESAGYKVGSYLSPHLQIINERFLINNKMAATTELANIFDEMNPAIQKVAAENPFGQPSNFEVQVAMAFMLFKQEDVDISVVEVGLGGTLDATNVLPAKISVLTNIGLDHTEILGDTIELIAQDKAGIIKAGQIVVSGVTQPATRQIVAERCKILGAQLWQLDQEFRVEKLAGLSVWFSECHFDNLGVDMQGEHQKDNAAIAIAACHAFSRDIPLSAFQQGLQNANIVGRFEVIQENPLVVLDGAHNPDKIKAAVQVVEHAYPGKRRMVVFALKSGKDQEEILDTLVPNTVAMVVTSFTDELWDAVEPLELAQTAKRIAPELTVSIEPDPLKAIEVALGLANQDDLILVTGSLYLLGNIREYWVPAEELIWQTEKDN